MIPKAVLNSATLISSAETVTSPTASYPKILPIPKQVMQGFALADFAHIHLSVSGYFLFILRKSP